MPSWADGEDKYMAAYRGESVDDAPARCRDCRDSFPQHCGDCGCCREAAPRAEANDATGLAIIALAAVVDGLMCRAQLPMGTQPAPVAECACRECETALVLYAAVKRLEAL